MIHFTLTRLLGHRGSGITVLGGLGLLGACVGATFVAQALILAQVFGRVVAAQEGVVAARDLAPWLIGLLAVLIARPALVAARELLAVRLMTRVKLTLRGDLAPVLIRTAAADVRGRSGDDHALLVDGVENLDAYLSKYLPQLVTVILTCGGVGVILVLVDPLVGVITLTSVLLLPFLPRLWDAALARRGADHWDAYGRMHGEFLDSMRGMTTLVLAGADARRQRDLEASSAALLERTLGQLRLSLIESGLSAFALSAVPVAALVGALGRGLPPTTVFTLVMLSVELVRPLRELSTHWHAGYAGTFSGRRILAVLDAAAPDGRWSPGLAATPAEADTCAGGVRLVEARDVSLTYPGAECASLNSVDLVLRPGINAIVGGSGSGKSTLGAVLAGLLEPQRGSVSLDGRGCTAATLLTKVALVPQDPVLFAGTVGDNIALARTAPTPPGVPDVAEAARLAGIGSEDSRIGLHTRVGERGGLISGGQRQRVAIARALHQGRDVLVLDEATSALDIATDSTMIARITARFPDVVIVLITHRIATLAPDTPVVTMRGGLIVEAGTTRELLRPGTYFARMAHASGVPA